jgi:hypothetical protein
MNDSMYLLSEGLAKMSSVIKELQAQLKSSKMGYEPSSLNQFRNRPELETLEWIKQQAAVYLHLIDRTVFCLKEVTAIVPDAFGSQGILDRLARFLNACQVLLTHESCKRLMVKDDADRQFNPTRLLSGLVDIYLNLRTQKEFVRANACEVYLEGLVDLLRSLKQYGITRSRDASGFEKFINTVKTQLQCKDGLRPSDDISDRVEEVVFAVEHLLSTLEGRIGHNLAAHLDSGISNLHQSIDNLQRVVSTSTHHLDRARHLKMLGIALEMRFKRTGSMQDLDQSISNSEQAVASIPIDHPDRGVYLNNLGIVLQTRFKQTGLM